jgi:hypothetical protein
VKSLFVFQNFNFHYSYHYFKSLIKTLIDNQFNIINRDDYHIFNLVFIVIDSYLSWYEYRKILYLKVKLILMRMYNIFFVISFLFSFKKIFIWIENLFLSFINSLISKTKIRFWWNKIFKITQSNKFNWIITLLCTYSYDNL